MAAMTEKYKELQDPNYKSQMGQSDFDLNSQMSHKSVKRLFPPKTFKNSGKDSYGLTDFKVHAILGAGAFGSVFLVTLNDEELKEPE